MPHQRPPPLHGAVAEHPVHQPRLADPGLALDDHQRRRAARRPHQEGQLMLPPDQGRRAQSRCGPRPEVGLPDPWPPPEVGLSNPCGNAARNEHAVATEFIHAHLDHRPPARRRVT